MQRLGFIGLGAMGLPMAKNLLKAGHPLIGYDIQATNTAKLEAAGGQAARSNEQLVSSCDIVFTSLPSPDAFQDVADNVFVPHARPDQVFIDMGTTTAQTARELGAALAEKGAHFLDAPVTGGAGGSASGSLRIFVGGPSEILERCRPYLACIGDPDGIVHCGPHGSGQIAKGVNQLAMGLINAAIVEAIAFGANAGISLETLRIVGGEQGWRRLFSGLLEKVIAGQGGEIGVKAGQLGYFLQEAEAKGFPMPLSQGLHDFLKDAEKVVMEANRLSPSFWNELMSHAQPEPLSSKTSNP